MNELMIRIESYLEVNKNNYSFGSNSDELKIFQQINDWLIDELSSYSPFANQISLWGNIHKDGNLFIVSEFGSQSRRVGTVYFKKLSQLPDFYKEAYLNGNSDYCDGTLWVKRR